MRLIEGGCPALGSGNLVMEIWLLVLGEGGLESPPVATVSLGTKVDLAIPVL